MVDVIVWIIIGVLVVLSFLLFKFEHHGKQIKLIAIVIIALLISFSLIAFFTTSDVDMKTPKGVVSAVYSYIGWVGHSVANLWESKEEITDLVGDAVKLNSTEK